MQMEYFLGNSDNVRMNFCGDARFELNLGRWTKVLCPKIGNNEVSTIESLSFDCAQYSKSIYSKTLKLE